MDEQGEIATLEDLDALLLRLGDFHDGVLKELHWINNDFVDTDLSLRPWQGSKARLLVQRQFVGPSAVELILHGIQWIRLDAREEVFDSSAGVVGNLLKLNIEDCEFVLERMTYRFASDWMGTEVRFGTEFGESNYEFHNELER